MLNNFIYMSIGMIIGVIISHRHIIFGTLKINKSNPEKDSYLFEIDNLTKLEKCKWVTLRVVKFKELNHDGK